MEHDANRAINVGLGIEALDALSTVSAIGISNDPVEHDVYLPSQAARSAPCAPEPPVIQARRSGSSAPTGTDCPFDHPRKSRFFQAVHDNPLRPSSEYPGLAGISPKLAIPIRQELLALGLLRQEALDVAGRGRTSLLLTVTEKGRTTLQAYRTLHGRES